MLFWKLRTAFHKRFKQSKTSILMKSGNKKWGEMVDDETIGKTMKALVQNGIKSYLAYTRDEACKMAIEMIPKGSEVMIMSSVTLDQMEFAKEIDKKGYINLKEKINSVGDKEKRDVMRRKYSAPDYAVGSVQAVTQNGGIIMASNTGSQLPAYAFGAKDVILIVGIQKIVKNIDDALKRINDYVLPLESERLKKVYGVPSNVSKILVINKEITPNRIHLIFVKEQVGF